MCYIICVCNVQGTVSTGGKNAYEGTTYKKAKQYNTQKELKYYSIVVKILCNNFCIAGFSTTG